MKISLQDEKEIWEKRYEEAKTNYLNDTSNSNRLALASLIHNLNVIDKKIYGINSNGKKMDTRRN